MVPQNYPQYHTQPMLQVDQSFRTDQAERWVASAEDALKATIWGRFERNAHHNFERILEGFIRHRVGEEHFASVTGYGHDDLGREVADKVFAHALQAESAMVRMQLVSGTHALATAIQGCVLPGERMVTLTGRPYDTLEEVIGLRGDSPYSIMGRGVDYQEIDLFEPNFQLRTTLTPEEEALIKSAQLVYIQRSRGYDLRPSINIHTIAWMVEVTRCLNPEAIILVDNCYGEFVEEWEPTSSDVGADLIAGSLIKNPGGGIAPTGGYIAGRADLVESCGEVLTCPGVGHDSGYTFNMTRPLLHGLYIAPGVVEEALKGMSLGAHIMTKAGFNVHPLATDERTDIVQCMILESPEALQQFCKSVQSKSPVNSHLLPVPSPLPGYESQVLMAGGTFIDGSSIELSADGPMREPYAVYFQGGLMYPHARIAIKQLIREFVPQFAKKREKPIIPPANRLDTSTGEAELYPVREEFLGL